VQERDDLGGAARQDVAPAAEGGGAGAARIDDRGDAGVDPPRSGLTPVRLQPSKTCAWTSINPGVTSLPLTSMTRDASAGAMPAATRAIVPFSTATSRTPSSPLDGSMTRPLFNTRSYIPGLRDAIEWW
jgi:hypothetical protein